jgi:hypothetical protein
MIEFVMPEKNLSNRIAPSIDDIDKSAMGRLLSVTCRVVTTATSLNQPIDPGPQSLLTEAFLAHYGTTAVTSISTWARSSTRSATCTSVMAG